MEAREYTSYSEIGNKILDRSEFRGNSVTGHRELGGVYAVDSYNQGIFRIYPTGKIEFNNKFYSVTTSKIQNLIARLFGLPTKRDGQVIIKD